MTDQEKTPAPPSESAAGIDEIRSAIAAGTAAEAEANVEGPPQEIVRRGGTFRAFGFRDYTLFWSGALVSNAGTWMQTAVLALVVYSLRHSEADSGIVNGVSQMPVFFLAIPAGLLADRVNRRTLLIWVQVGLMAQALALGILYATGMLSPARPVLSLALIAGLGLVAGLLAALTFPAWQAMIPDLLPRDALLNGVALNAAQFQSARLLGPMAASLLLLAGAGMGDIFFINAASFIFVIAALAVIRTRRVTPRADDALETRESAIKTLTAGIDYAVHHRTVGMLLLSLAMLSLFGMPYMTLLPAIVDKALVPAIVTGAARDAVIERWALWTMSANGFGAVAGALIVASLPRSVRRERLVLYALLAMAVLVMTFAMSRTLWLTLVISAVTGAAFLTSTSLINTGIQMRVPHELRGRVMALFVMGFMGLMPWSSLAFGYIGKAIGPTKAVIAGAAVLVAYAFALLLRPSLLAGDGEADAAPVSS